MALKTDYKDDVLNTELNTKRKYRMIYNDDDTVSFEDVTQYLQTGTMYSSEDVNEENTETNAIRDLVGDGTLETTAKNLVGGVNELNSNFADRFNTFTLIGSHANLNNADGNAGVWEDYITLSQNPTNFKFIAVVSAYYSDRPTAVYGILIIPITLYFSLGEYLFFPCRRPDDGLAWNKIRRHTNTKMYYVSNNGYPVQVYGIK